MPYSEFGDRKHFLDDQVFEIPPPIRHDKSTDKKGVEPTVVAKDSTAPERDTGYTLDRYGLGAKLGKGGFANAYSAYLKLDNVQSPSPDDMDFVVKILHKCLFEDEDHKRMFLQELKSHVQAEAVSPYVVSIIDMGSITDPETGTESVGIVTSRVRDGDLIDLEEQFNKAGEEISDDLIGTIAVQIAKAIRGIHHAGFVHRDIKLSNVFVHKDPFYIQLGDFGIAKSMHDISMINAPTSIQRHNEYDPKKHTDPKLLTGTPQYLPPEAFSQNDISTDLDLYALGIVLYEIRTGGRPFEGTYSSDEEGEIAKHRKENPPSIKKRLIKKAYKQIFGKTVYSSESVEGVYDALISTLIQRKPADRKKFSYTAKDTTHIVYPLDTADAVVFAFEDIARREKLSLEGGIPENVLNVHQK